MEQVLRLNNTDQRITYGSGWTSISNSGVGQNRTYSLTSNNGTEIFFMFRGIVPLRKVHVVNFTKAKTPQETPQVVVIKLW